MCWRPQVASCQASCHGGLSSSLCVLPQIPGSWALLPEPVSRFCPVLSAPSNPLSGVMNYSSGALGYLHKTLQRKALNWDLSLLVTDECCLLMRAALVSGQWKSLSIYQFTGQHLSNNNVHAQSQEHNFTASVLP